MFVLVSPPLYSTGLTPADPQTKLSAGRGGRGPGPGAPGRVLTAPVSPRGGRGLQGSTCSSHTGLSCRLRGLARRYFLLSLASAGASERRKDKKKKKKVGGGKKKRKKIELNEDALLRPGLSGETATPGGRTGAVQGGGTLTSPPRRTSSFFFPFF